MRSCGAGRCRRWRGRAATRARIDGSLRVGEQVRLCGVGAQAQVAAPDGSRIALLPDPAAGSQACAGFWPTQAGWHALAQGGRSQDFHVRALDDAPGLRASELREATLALALALRSPPAAAGDAVAVPTDGERGSPWPWFAAWLALCAALWWFERSRLGRASGSAPSDSR
ncbi:hypothetical protein FE772_13335 [Lysobacter enzymogenes]|nr:hypothetical protein [Lysobacter enzymogenes]QCW26501.1 hypothetical protein FE772_13335 [Lysobacter enzymogenes]